MQKLLMGAAFGLVAFVGIPTAVAEEAPAPPVTTEIATPQVLEIMPSVVAPDAVVNPVVVNPEMCFNGAPFVLSEAGWTCDFPLVGGFKAGDTVCYATGRHKPPRCYQVPQRVLDLVSRYFPPMQQNWAVLTVGCESTFDEHSDNHKGFGGYFQHHKRSFPTRERAAVRYWADRGVSWSGRGVFDGESNTATSAYWATVTKVDQQWQCSGKGWKA